MSTSSRCLKVAVLEDQSVLVSCSEDDTVKLWPVPLVLGGKWRSPGPEVFPPFALLDAIKREGTAALRHVLERHPATLFAPALIEDDETTLLSWAATRSDYTHALKAMMDTPGPLVMDLTPEPSVLLKAVEDSRDASVIRLVSRKISEAARNHDDALHRPRDASGWMLDPHTLRMHFTEDVLVMIKDFPALAGEFLSTIGLVRVDTDQGYDHDLTQLPASGFIVVGSEHVSLNRRLWSDLADSGELETLEDGSVSMTLTEARMVPLKRAAAFLEDGTSLLDRLTTKGDATLFGNLTARAVVQFKWQAFAQRKFLLEFAWYLLTLALITALTFVFNTQGLDVAQLLTGVGDGSSDGGSGADIASVVLLVALDLMAGMDAATKVRQSRIVAGYFKDFWNWLDMLNCALVFAVLCTYFGGWEHARARSSRWPCTCAGTACCTTCSRSSPRAHWCA